MSVHDGAVVVIGAAVVTVVGETVVGLADEIEIEEVSGDDAVVVVGFSKLSAADARQLPNTMATTILVLFPVSLVDCLQNKLTFRPQLYFSINEKKMPSYLSIINCHTDLANSTLTCYLP